jgi:hypothetical protein
MVDMVLQEIKKDEMQVTEMKTRYDHLLMHEEKLLITIPSLFKPLRRFARIVALEIRSNLALFSPIRFALV